VTELARTIFLGSGTFAVPIVSALAEHPLIDLIAVVTAPTRRGSRGRPTDPPVAEWAAERGLPMLRPARLRDPASIAEVGELRPDLLVLADYGQIVPAVLLELPRHGALNLHPSLLPRHRGAAPIPAAILQGDQETGVSLMLMDAELDTGPLIAQRRLALDGFEIAPGLESALAVMSAEVLDASLEPWLNGELEPEPQPAEGATVTRPLHREDGRLDPAVAGAQLERQVRAYQPWPGSFIETPEGRVVVWRSRVGDPRGAVPGTLIEAETGALGLAASDGLLELVEVQPAGGRRMTGTELLRGRPGLIGSTVLRRAEAT
jgi:methionyl-tRNA formyltransferase